jgi:hypothetical protein
VLIRVEHLDDRAAAIQVFLGQKLLAIFLEARGPADAEDVLPHAAPHPVLRVVKREEPRSEAERLALLVEAFPARDVVEGELHVVQLRSEVRLVGVLHRLARAGLVVDDLHLAVADIVDAVDLADNLRAVELKAEPALDRNRAQPANELHARDELDVVGEHRPHLALFALAVEHALHVREVRLEVTLQGGLEPLLLMVPVERPPVALVGVEVLEHPVQESAALHRDRPRFLDEAGMVVVPVQARTFQVVVERRRAEVIDLHGRGVAAGAKGLERLACVGIGQERDVETERRRAGRNAIREGGTVGGQQDFGLACQQHVAWLEAG